MSDCVRGLPDGRLRSAKTFPRNGRCPVQEDNGLAYRLLFKFHTSYIQDAVTRRLEDVTVSLQDLYTLAAVIRGHGIVKHTVPFSTPP